MQLKVENVSKVYGKDKNTTKALEGAKLDINKGEFVTIIGPSGSGKSTLLNILGGVDKPSSGRVLLNGEDITKYSEKKMAKYRRKNIGFVHQFFNLLPMLTVEENIKMPVFLDKKKVDKAYLNELLIGLGIADKSNNMPSELSGGQQQRAAIARALINKPEIILADEPTGNLDTTNTFEIMKLLKATVKKYNQTLILITHNDEIAKMGDRIIKIVDGRLFEV